jgi:hypothetical protein
MGMAEKRLVRQSAIGKQVRAVDRCGVWFDKYTRRTL